MACFADTQDLETLVKELGQKPNTVKPAELPTIKFNDVDYKLPENNNIFDSKRSEVSNDNLFQIYDNKYSLNQLQMVGYMHYHNIDYAMLKTPYETIKVKVGDSVKNGKVIKITEEMTEIDELDFADGKSYNRKRFFNLNAATDKNKSLVKTK